MSEKYRTEQQHSLWDILSPGLVTETVYDRDSGERVGELVRWDWQKSGDLIAEGDWKPDKDNS